MPGRPAMLLMLILNMGMVVWSQQTSPPITPSFPPLPTSSHVVNESLVVFVGDLVRVEEDVRVTIDCGPLIDEAINNGISNPTVTWVNSGAELSNGSAVNVEISADRRFCIITNTLLAVGGQLGNDGQYTCEVCNNTICMNKTSRVFVCGYPNLVSPTSQPLVLPVLIVLTCGQDITVETLVGVSTLIIQCAVFNGSELSTMQVFKDGKLINSDGLQVFITLPTNDDFGTYTFVASTEGCGSTSAVSRLIRQANAPDIDEGPFILPPPTVMPGDMTATIGTPIYIVDGFNVTLVCHIASGTRPITIMWLRNNAPYPAGGNHSVITIPDTDYDDGDIFTCRADNIVGFDMENSIINVSMAEEDCSVTMVSGKVRHNRRRNRTRFRFSSDGDPEVTYRCKLDDGKFNDCKSPMTWRNLGRGRHTIAVTASCVDDEGNRFSTARRNFSFRIR